MSRAIEKKDNLEADIAKHSSRLETDASRSTSLDGEISALQSVQQCLMEQTIESPVVSLADKIVEMPVTQTQEKTQQVVNTHVQYVVNTVKVEKPGIIKQTVQKPISVTAPVLEAPPVVI